MAVDNEINTSKQLPHFPDGSTTEFDTYYTNQWSMENVVKWLETHGWGSVAPRFELHNIQGQSFLDLSMSKLTEVIPRSELAYGDKRRLLHSIHSIQVSNSQQLPLKNDENTVPSHYLDTSCDYIPNESNNFKTSPISSTSTSSYSSLITPTPYISKSPVSNCLYQEQQQHDLASSLTSTNVAPSLETEYARIRPFIPERKSSNPEQISKIMKQFNVPPSLPLARARPNPIISRRSKHTTKLQCQPINGPRQLSNNDNKDSWKISRRAAFPKTKQGPQGQVIKEQRIQVTVDSDTFFSLTVTNINDPTTLKSSILNKVGIQANALDNFQFFHENGDNSDISLGDDELLYICNHSDNLKHRILVKSLHSNNTDNIDHTSLYTPQESSSLWLVPPNTVNASNISTNSTVYNNQGNTLSTSLWAVPPRPMANNNAYSLNQQPSAQLWAVPPRSIEDNSNNNNTPKTSMSPISAPLWAISPRSTDTNDNSCNQNDTSSHTTGLLWAIPPRPINNNENNNNKNDNNSSNDNSSNASFRDVSSSSAELWAIPPRSMDINKNNFNQNDTSLHTTGLPWATPRKPICSNSPTSTNLLVSASLWAVPPQSIETGFKPGNEIPQSSSVSLWAVPPKQTRLSPASSPTLFKSSNEPSALWEVSPKNIEEYQKNDTLSAGLWAVPPKMSPSNSSSTTTSSVHDQNTTNVFKDTKQVSIPTPPSSSSALEDPLKTNSHYQQIHQKNNNTNDTSNNKCYLSGGNITNSEALHTSLKAVKLEDPPVSLNTSSSSSTSSTSSTPTLISSPSLNPTLATSVSAGTRNQNRRLHIQIPSEQHQSNISAQPISPQYPSSNSSSSATMAHTSGMFITENNTSSLHTPQSSSENGSPVISSQELTDVEEDNWAERPSIEKLYRDIDKYLPGHDLDKEITVETENNGNMSINSTAAAPLTRKLQGHKKSVRVVVNEAHRNWRQAVNVIRVNNILRRKSTKMWGHKVQQVKPGMTIASDKEDNQSTLPNGKPAPTKLQWMRGQLIGKGSYGRVYHALNVPAGEWIAVKQVDIPTTTSDHRNKQLSETADALYREISLLKDLEHENIVQYLGYDVDEEEGYINIFLEYVPGGSIQSCLSKQGKFDESLVSFLTRQILLGLEYLHDRNILHRDIKAGNVLITHTGTCKITDFGLSKLSGQDKAYDAHANNSVMRGTVFWMAPEVVSGTNYNAKIDIWSLGCTVIEMLTGKHPWLDMNMFAALYSLGRFEAPPIPDGITENAKNFLELCFKINPEERPTAADLLVHPFVGQNPSFKFKEHMKS